MTDALSLAADFDAPTRRQWQSLVTAVLRKSGAVGPDEEPTAPESLLATTTYDGVQVKPLYTAEDVADLPPSGVPGAAPFVRGATVDGNAVDGWDTRTYHVTADPSVLNADVLQDLTNGANSLWLRVGDGGLPVDRLADALEGVHIDMAPVVLDAGDRYASAAEELLAVISARGIEPASAVGTIGADPIGLRARTGEPHDVDVAAQLAAWVAPSHPGIRTIVVDGLPYHDAGGSDAQELAASIASGVAYLRALVDAGLSVDTAADQLEFRYAATADQFGTIAKLRAARRLWARVVQASGGSAAQRQHAVTSSAMLTRRDPWVNMLRGTVACFGAAVGGADAITVQPFDAAVGQPDAFSRRIARNTSSVLGAESKLGAVIDPVGGSWYVESLTDDLARAAWTLFQAIEAEGGIEHVLDSGWLAERLEQTWQARRANLATRTDPITGISEFPNLHEDSLDRPPFPSTVDGGLPRRRYAQDYEALRDAADAYADKQGHRPKVFLATLGPVAQHTARATFAANLLAAGGIEAINPGATESTADVLGAFVSAHTDVAVLCGTDIAYAEQADEVAAALTKAGAKAVLLADKPSDVYSGVTGFVHKGCNAIEVLTGLHKTLGVCA